MRRFLSTLFITLVLVISATGAAPAVHAQTCNETAADVAGSPCSTADGSYGTCVVASEFGGYVCQGSGTNYDPTTVADPAAEKTTNNDKLGPPTTPKATLNGIMAYIAQLFAWLLGVAIITLDYAVFYTVVTMGSYVKDLSAVGITWQIMRDIGNIVIIFGFLAIGISIILNTERMGYGKKMLPMLLVAAVFLNFSLFLSEAVIDTGNLFATQFYTQINGGQPAGTKISAGRLTGINNEGISNKIMSSLGLMTIYGDVKNNNAKGGAEDLLENSWTIGFMSIILFLVAAFVLFALAFILIARFVILLFLIIIAPIGFAGLAVPQLKGTADKWWKALFEQTITAPVLLLLLYIALRVITDTKFLTGLGAISWTGTLSNNIDSFARTLISFLIAMGLLLAVVIISKKMSAVGAAGASALAGKLSFGATAWGMRNTAGLSMQRLSQKIESSKWARNKPILGRAAQGLVGVGAKASFDIRGAKAFGGLKGIGIDAGEAQKGGYRQWEKDAIKGREDYDATLTISKDDEKKIKTEEDLIKALKKLGDDIKAGNDKEMKELNTKHSTDPNLLSTNADIDQKRKNLKAAEATGDPNKIRDAQLAFNNSLLDRQQIREKQNKERDDLKKEHDRKVNENNTEIAGKEKFISDTKKAPQVEYAEMLEKMPWGGMYRNSKAAENIRKSAGKSKEQKDVENIMELAKKYAATSGTTPTPAPMPPPAGGATTP